MAEHKLSLSKFYRFLFVLFLITFFLAMGSMSIIGSSLRQKVVETFTSRINSQIKMIESSHQSMEKAMADLLLQNENITLLNGEPDIYTHDTAVRDLKNEFKTISSYFFSSYHFFYYNMDHQEWIAPTPASISYNTTEGAGVAIREFISSNQDSLTPSNNKWLLLHTEDDTFFIAKIYHTGPVYVGCWSTVDYLYERFGVNRYSSVNESMFLVKNNALMTETSKYSDLLKTTELYVSQQNKTFSKGSYEMIWQAFEKSDFSLIFVFDVLAKYRSMMLWIVLLFTVIFSVLSMGLFLLIFIQRKLTLPIRQFINNLDTTRINPPPGLHFDELDQINAMFQNARQQINDLKIKTYEQKLESYKLEMDYLQVQIKPHFYINCMTLIYNMAQSGHMKQIQQLALETSDYLRSIFRHGNVPVTLEEELLHIQKYLNINAIRYGDSFSWKITLPENLKPYRIIPLMMHTLIENSIKHGLVWDPPLTIQIDVRLENNNEGVPSALYLSVRDSGPGYPSDVLRKLNADMDCRTPSGKRIGLYNLKRRISFFYQDEACILFSNPKNGGALAEVRIPLKYAYPAASPKNSQTPSSTV